MFYCIDFDSRQVECQSESKEELDKYVSDNDLELAVAIIDSPDELCLQFSLNELRDTYGSLRGNPPEFRDEDAAAEAVWKALECADDIPKFNGSLKLIKESEAPKPTKKKSPPKQKSGASRSKLNLKDPLFILEPKCKSGSILSTIVKAVEEEFCETVGEVRQYILDNHVIPKTGELADEKFADHNLKYFIKQGKISTEEEL